MKARKNIPQIVSKDFNSDCQIYRIGIRNKSCKQNTPSISLKILKEKTQSSIASIFAT